MNTIFGIGILESTFMQILILGTEHLYLINQTMKDIATNTCIRFRKTDGNDGYDYIDILNMKGYLLFLLSSDIPKNKRHKQAFFIAVFCKNFLVISK